MVIPTTIYCITLLYHLLSILYQLLNNVYFRLVVFVYICLYLLMINIIHNSKRVDRRKLLQIEFEKLKIKDEEVKLWDAVTDLGSTTNNINAAHKMIVQDAKDRGMAEVTIAEDDFFFPSQDGLEFFLKNKPISFDVYLSGIYVGFEPLNDNNNKVGFFSGLHFYIVHSKFYDNFLSLNPNNAIDGEIGQMALKGLADVYCCYPMAAIQQETPSDNNNGIVFSHRRFNRTKVLGLIL